MYSICALPKPFSGHVGVIQANAIRSWNCLKPAAEIILFGTDAGTAEFAAELGLKHVPDLVCNEYGTPLRDSLLARAENAANHDILCHVNSDIILFDDFPKALEAVLRKLGDEPFLMIGRRWNIDLDTAWDFSLPDWEARLKAFAASEGGQRNLSGWDYFVFRRGMFRDVPAFAIGRFSEGNWMIRHAITSGIPVIDVTRVVTAFHQSHNYAHQRSLAGSSDAVTADNRDPDQAYGILVRGVEAQRNVALAGGENPFVSPYDMTFLLNPRGELVRQPLIGRIYRGLYWYRLPPVITGAHPFRWPLRLVSRLVQTVRALKTAP